MDTSLRRSVGWLTAIRVAVLLLILLSALLVQAGSGTTLEISFLWAVNAAAAGLALFHWTVGRHLSPRLAAAIQLAGDLAIVSVLVYSSGGPDSVFNFLYLVVIGASAFLLYRAGAVLVQEGPAAQMSESAAVRVAVALTPCQQRVQHRSDFYPFREI